MCKVNRLRSGFRGIRCDAVALHIEYLIYTADKAYVGIVIELPVLESGSILKGAH